MARLASDADNTEFVGAHNPDDLLHVTFYSKSVHQPFQSEKEGRPIFKDVDFVTIHTPGNQLNIIKVPVDESHKFRFPKQWARYEAGKKGDEQTIGTPLSQWPILTPAQCDELRAMKFFTVDQIAGASDEQIQRIGMAGGMSPLAFRDRAKRFLTVAHDNAEVERYNAELKKRDDEIAEMKRQLETLTQAQSATDKTLHLKKGTS